MKKNTLLLGTFMIVIGRRREIRYASYRSHFSQGGPADQPLCNDPGLHPQLRWIDRPASVIHAAEQFAGEQQFERYSAGEHVERNQHSRLERSPSTTLPGRLARSSAPRAPDAGR